MQETPNMGHSPVSVLPFHFFFSSFFSSSFFLPPSFPSLLFFIPTPFPSPFFPYPISFSPPPFSTESIDLLKLEQKHYIHSIEWEQAPEITWLEIQLSFLVVHSAPLTYFAFIWFYQVLSKCGQEICNNTVLYTSDPKLEYGVENIHCK